MSMDVSVITPVYNEENTLTELYERLSQQKNINFEWILIDDGSTDDTCSVIESIIKKHTFETFNIKLIKKKNGGAATARRLGIETASSDYIAILDADDQLSNDALHSGLSKFNSQVDMVCFLVNFMSQDGKHISNFQYKPSSWPISGNDALSMCIYDWGITGFAIMKKSLLIEAYKIYDNYLGDAGNTINGDEFLSRLCFHKSKFIDICDGTYLYTVNPESTTRKINENYHRVLITAIAFKRYLKDEASLTLIKKGDYHIFYVFCDVYKRFKMWDSQLSDKSEWIKTFSYASRTVDFISLIIESVKLRRFHRVWKKIVMFFMFRMKQ